jgi:hypothetical protein
MLIASFIAWVVIRLFYLISGFNPVQNPAGVLGYLIDLGIWIPVCLLSFWSLGVLGMGKKPRE